MIHVRNHTRRIFIALFLLLPVTLAWSQGERPEVFDRQEVMVTMRDGVRLQTAIFTPKAAKAPLPILLTRTPYGVPANEGFARSGNMDELIADGYIFVWQNLRGRFKSEGTFVMQRAPRDSRDPKAVDESTDAYDTVDWLVKNAANNNGRAGIFGISYPGWTATMALLGPHPALKCISEQASPADMFLGDDFHHNGAFRLSYGFEYAALLETSKEANTNFKFDKHDTYDWYLELGALSHVNAKYFREQIPTWNDFVNHPNRDQFWRAQAYDSFLREATVPNLNVAGWWDQEDFYGPQKIYELLEPNDKKQWNHFVAGPWNHGGWARGRGDRLGPVQFGSDTAKHFRANIQAPWFAYWLHGKGKLDLAEAVTFQTGTNQWKSYEAWPPKKGVTQRKLYFHANRKASFQAPDAAGQAFDQYTSDPAHPVPYRPRPIPPTYPGPDWPVWMLQDQRFADHRPDVLSWQTEPLTEDVAVVGNIVADLFASTTGSDADWIVKLIDVYPDDYQTRVEPGATGFPNRAITAGYQLIIAAEVFRGRFRNSFERPEAIPSNQVLEYKVGLHTNNHVFLKGHRIMVQVQSTWFPLIDRNPQKYVPNIYQARDSDYVEATHRIHRSAKAASAIILPVMTQ